MQCSATAPQRGRSALKSPGLATQPCVTHASSDAGCAAQLAYQSIARLCRRLWRRVPCEVDRVARGPPAARSAIRVGAGEVHNVACSRSAASAAPAVAQRGSVRSPWRICQASTESTISRLLKCQVHQRGAAGSQGVRRRPGRRHAHALALALPGWEQPAEAKLPRVLACASACRRGARQINGARPRRVPLNMKTVFPSHHACIVHWWDASMQPRGTVWQRRAMFARGG